MQDSKPRNEIVIGRFGSQADILQQFIRPAASGCFPAARREAIKLLSFERQLFLIAVTRLPLRTAVGQYTTSSY